MQMIACFLLEPQRKKEVELDILSTYESGQNMDKSEVSRNLNLRREASGEVSSILRLLKGTINTLDCQHILKAVFQSIQEKKAQRVERKVLISS